LKTITPALKQIASGLRFPEGPWRCRMARWSWSRSSGARFSRVTAGWQGARDRRAWAAGRTAPPWAARQIYVTNNGGLKFVERPGKLFPVAQATTTRAASSGGRRRDGKIRDTLDACAGAKLRGPKRPRVRHAGGFWFNRPRKTRERDMDRGAVFYAKADGSMIKEAIFPLERRNGIGLSPTSGPSTWSRRRGALLGFRLSAPGEIESANGPYRGEKGTVVTGLGGYQMLDSLAVDGEGHICVATLITAPSATSGRTAVASISTSFRT